MYDEHAVPARPDGPRWDFFVSYAGGDQSWAEWIAWQLEAATYRVLVQAWDFVPGSHWTSRIEEGVGEASRTIALLSEEYLRSVHAGAEWRAVYGADINGIQRLLIPVRVADCPPPRLLEGLARIDLFGLEEEQARSRLLTGVDSAMRGRAKPSSTPPYPGVLTVFERHTSLRPPTVAPAFPVPGSRSWVAEQSQSSAGVRLRRAARGRRTVPLEASDPVQIGGHVLLARLGVTSRATVFLGRTADERLVAVKVAHPHLADTERDAFRHETVIARQVRSVHTPRIVAADADAERPYLVTEFVEGPTLEEDVRLGGPLPRAELLQLAVHLLLSIADLHRSGVLHRDLTPSNVILSLSGPRLIDFGISRRLDAAAGNGSLVTGAGTFHYMAPERWLGEPESSATDVFAWACLVGYAASGRPTFQGRGRDEVRRAVLQDEPDLGGLDSPETTRTDLAVVTAATETALDVALRDAAWDALSKDPAGRPGVTELLVRLGTTVVDDGGLPGTTVPFLPTLSDMLFDGSAAGGSPSRRGTGRADGPSSLPGQGGPVTRRRILGVLAGVGVTGGAAAAALVLTGGSAPGQSTSAGADPVPTEPEQPAGAQGPAVGRIRDRAVAGAVFGPGGTTLALGEEGKVSLFDVSDPTRPRFLAATNLEPTIGPDAIAVSRDGRLLAACSGDGFLNVLRLEGENTGIVQFRRAHRKTLYGLAFSPDGSLLATASRDQTVRLWRTGEPLRVRPVPPAYSAEQTPTDEPLVTLEGHRNTVRSVAFSPTGSLLASAAEDQRVILWDVGNPAEAKMLRVLDPGVAAVHLGSVSVEFSPDGALLAASLCSNEVVLWDVRAPAAPVETSRIGGDRHTDGVECLAFAPANRGSVLATASRDHTLMLWDYTDARNVRNTGVFGEHEDSAVVVTAFSPDGSVLLSAGDDRNVFLRTRW